MLLSVPGTDMQWLYPIKKNETNYNTKIAASKRYTRMQQIHLGLRVKYFRAFCEVRRTLDWQLMLW